MINNKIKKKCNINLKSPSPNSTYDTVAILGKQELEQPLNLMQHTDDKDPRTNPVLIDWQKFLS